MYGTFVDGLSQKQDSYGFVNEREIRIAAGVSLLFALFALFAVLLKSDYDKALYVIAVLWIDFVIKVFVGPKFSPLLAAVRPFVRNSPAQYVGAVQKRFAWGIGLGISTLVAICLLVQSGTLVDWGIANQGLVETKDFIAKRTNMDEFVAAPVTPPVLLCFVCVAFMWFESVAGYCVGCAIYRGFVNAGWMKSYPNQNCADGVCATK